MATEENTTYSLNFALNLVRGGETAKRNLAFDYTGGLSTGGLSEAAVNQVAQTWLADYNKLIQPNQWRDTDSAEEEWTTIGITPTAKETKTITYEAQSASTENASPGQDATETP